MVWCLARSSERGRIDSGKTIVVAFAPDFLPQNYNSKKIGGNSDWRNDTYSQRLTSTEHAECCISHIIFTQQSKTIYVLNITKDLRKPSDSSSKREDRATSFSLTLNCSDDIEATSSVAALVS